MTLTSAWLLECSESFSIAISDHEMVEYVQSPVCYGIPATPPYCNSVMFWQNDFIPVMDVAGVNKTATEQANDIVCILNYQVAPMLPLQSIAVRANKAPEKIQVDDQLACDFPQEISASILSNIVLSSFTHADQSVLVLDIPKLCSAEFRQLANASR